MVKRTLRNITQTPGANRESSDGQKWAFYKNGQQLLPRDEDQDPYGQEGRPPRRGASPLPKSTGPTTALQLTSSICRMENLLNQATGCSEQEMKISIESNAIDKLLTRLQYHVKCISIQIRELLTSRQTKKLAANACAPTSTTNDNLNRSLPPKRPNRAQKTARRTQFQPFNNQNLFKNGPNIPEHLKITSKAVVRPDISPSTLREELGSITGRPVLNLTTSGDESFTIRVDTKLQSDAMLAMTSISQQTCTIIAHTTYSKSSGLIYIDVLPSQEAS